MTYTEADFVKITRLIPVVDDDEFVPYERAILWYCKKPRRTIY